MRDDHHDTLIGGIAAIIALSLIIISSGTKLCVGSASGTGKTSTNLDLTDLSNLKIEDSATDSDLLNETYWDSVINSFESSVVQMLPNTVLGYFDKSVEWNRWALQTVPSPPPWLSSGLESYLEAQIPALKARLLSAHNATLAALILRDLAGSIAGYGLAALDFVSFNGVTALRTYLANGNAVAAVCATFPSQLGLLYNQAFDTNVPRKMRAQYLGNALAITTMMIALAGADGFSPKFKVALERVGLADSWSTIKSLLGKLPSRTAYLAFSILQRIASRFPSDASWATGFAADRIESMVEVLKQKSVSEEAIDGEITKLVKVADSSPNPDDVPFAADVSSYNDGGGIRVKLNSANRIFLYSDSHGIQSIKVSFLEKEVAGFVKERLGPLKVRILEKGATLYLRYEAGKTWRPPVSGDVAGPNEVLTITVNVPTRDDFISNLREISLGNTVGARWVSDVTELRGFSVSGNDLRIDATQYPAIEGVSGFKLRGPVSESFGFYNQWTTLDFQIKDLFGNTRGMRMYHDGYHSPWLGIFSGEHYRSVYTLSYDGARLRVVYTDSREFNVATLYMSDPSVFYDLGEVGPSSLSQIPAVSKIYEIQSVDFPRPLEKNMIFEGTGYDHGRVGAEIAYTVGRVKYGLQDLVIREPSMGGADLITQDRTVVMQARFIQDFSQFKGMSWEEALQSQLGKLVSKLGQDFENNHSLVRGYAVLSYLDPSQPNVIKTIVAEVSAPVMRP